MLKRRPPSTKIARQALRSWSVSSVLYGPLIKAERLFNAAQVLTQPSQNELAFFTARHFGAKQPKDEGVGCLSNAPDCCVGSLFFQLTQASPVDERLWILADGRATKLRDAVARQAQDD